MGTLLVAESFAIKGQGFVVAGEIIEGTCSIGEIARHPNGSEFEITGIEILDKRVENERVGFPALLLSAEAVTAADLSDSEKWIGLRIETGVS